MTAPIIQTREATLAEDTLIATHFYHLWRDNQISEEFIQPDWREMILEFIDRARQALRYQAFVAEAEGQIIGSAGCQLYPGDSPCLALRQAGLCRAGIYRQ